ncbi:GNAT family N-acetyltransferase [Phycicoccus sp. CSK15P-2]|uniref:GNAT family N-acetyltransferase n=1 Tax=Phycicoccus sp. CSK15P-2 TaxID=2807627 RepID=UPI00194DCF74|nr:GNAT family N-acetyltransferase [Phycicoccus sp. CSK15P-2]MBM6403041.1 GNAT family N-acetyltransferase [Phycicoccus sp. CSK15P-2]
MTVVRSAPTAELPAVVLHELLRLRQDVFVLEQECLYPDIDGRDLEPGALQFWAEGEDGGVTATLRVLDDGGGVVRVGRVATARAARGAGVAAALVQAVLAATRGPVVLDAQAHLEHWYARFGFERDGAEFLEDGISHVPMRLYR